MLEDAMGFSDIPESKVDELSGIIDEMCWGFEYGEVFELKKHLRFKLGRAGHVLGSCFVRIDEEQAGWSNTFSGDLGASDTPLLPDPDAPDACDLLILESTYGDTLHGSRHDHVHRLGAILDKALSDGGKVFIPAFALGRAQELIYEIDRLFSDPDLQKTFPRLRSAGIPVLIDSPLSGLVSRRSTQN